MRFCLTTCFVIICSAIKALPTVEFSSPNGGPWIAPDGKKFMTARPEWVMPVGAGDLSAMVSFGEDTLHLHFSKTDWFSGTPRHEEIASPGHVAVIFGGLTTNAMTAFSQKMDMARGCVTLKISTADGDVAAIIAGDRETGALFADISDGRARRGETRVECEVGKPCAKYAFTAQAVGDISTGVFTVVAAADRRSFDDARNLSFAVREKRRLQWWKDYWDRGWISLEGDERAELLDRLWHVNLYVWASVGYGPIPPKFNGGAGLVYGDDRGWGRKVWYQNTREMIWPMCTANRPEFAESILDLYDSALGMRALNTSSAYPEFKGLPGVVLQEVLEIFESDRVSGKNTPRPDVTAPYVEPTAAQRRASRQKRLGKRAHHVSHTYSSGTELLQQMIEYVRFTGDRSKVGRIAEWLRTQTELYLTILEKGEDGKWHTYGTNVNESWWVVDDSICDLAAARYVLAQTVAHGAEFGFPGCLIGAAKTRLEALASYPMLDDVAWEPKRRFMKVSSFVPGNRFYAPCAFTNGQEKSNFENNELYLVHPFGMANCFVPGKDRDRALETFRRGPNTTGGYGWTPVGIAAAWMRYEKAADVVFGHARNTCRWPFGGGRSPSRRLYRGSEVEESPYLDGTGVMQTGVQELLLQSQANEPDVSFFTGGVIRLIPCVPKTWSGAYKLRARGGFIVKCSFTKGVVKACTVESLCGNKLVYEDPRTRKMISHKTAPGERVVIVEGACHR